MSNGLDSDLIPNCSQRLSADDNSRHYASRQRVNQHTRLAAASCKWCFMGLTQCILIDSSFCFDTINMG